MNILFSTNTYKAEEFHMAKDLLKEFKEENLGIEVFPMFHEDSFENALVSCLDDLKGRPISFHGAYYKTEHSKEKGTDEYTRAMEYFDLVMKYCKELNSTHIVFHHNNCVVNEDEKSKLIEVSRENLKELNAIANASGVKILVENAGVISRKNMLFDEQEFIDECLSIDNLVLIDIGHAYANGWNLRNVIEKLQHKIVAYHVHNNDGYHDDHERIYSGVNSFDEFLQMYKEFTPDADLVLEYNMGFANKMGEIIEDLRKLFDFKKSL